MNRGMVHRALEWLDVQPDERVLDLFCGLGNFTLPLARKAAQVVGVEGDESMVVRGRENSERNRLSNAEFHGADLQADFTRQPWAGEGFDKILIDPPRSGALEVCEYLTAFGARRVVYVSCNPATLARDAGALVRNGYRLVRAGVMDMFPHTTHVESMALFERKE
jgi:23S rRNA (uracil1939-C5)-methyltransferase